MNEQVDLIESSTLILLMIEIVIGSDSHTDTNENQENNKKEDFQC